MSQRRSRGRIPLVLVSIFAAALTLAADIDWADIEGRTQYAYYTEDARALNGVLASLEPKPVEGEAPSAAQESSRSYFRALAYYRLAQVLSTGKKSKARGAVDDCGKQIDHLVDALPKLALGVEESDAVKHQRAEAYALGTACTIAGREMTSIPFVGGRIGSRIDEAVKLEPKNPRVRLVEALAAFDRAGNDAAARNAALQKLRNVTVMFEAARAGASSTPEWGAAEAYAFLGRALFDQRDLVGAREALERALLVAPDYAYARRLMAQITR
ncbi:MAG TPA: hypothetical protein VFL16_08160 [Steroidobacteraceae bacterium]|nr:hypothetical protein [Steroidobacteraceae bacterium]